MRDIDYLACFFLLKSDSFPNLAVNLDRKTSIDIQYNFRMGYFYQTEWKQ